jgi:hypothetical protein
MLTYCLRNGLGLIVNFTLGETKPDQSITLCLCSSIDLIRRDFRFEFGSTIVM